MFIHNITWNMQVNNLQNYFLFFSSEKPFSWGCAENSALRCSINFYDSCDCILKFKAYDFILFTVENMIYF